MTLYKLQKLPTDQSKYHGWKIHIKIHVDRDI